MEKIRLYLKMIKPHRIKNAVSIWRKEGLAGIKYHFFLVKDKEKGSETDCSREYDILQLIESENLGDFQPMEFVQSANPLVSILIPVYNQFSYTYNCLQSIKKYAGDIAYEIIIGDDNSTDLTRELEKVVKGVMVIHHEKNLQFLMNCNRISREASGKYLVFLNNDTQVQKNWLKTLVDLMEKEENIGLAGSKLIYSNGLVQEAGGIVWKDAAVLQYGNNRQPGEEELNDIRETDYISGASIIIRRKLWEEIGGFDRRFAPAYYEDVDLAFQVKEKGYKVVYQPESEVIHFEGVTENGTDEQGREKKQEKIEENRIVFYNKWKEKLQNQHFSVNEYPELIRKMKMERKQYG